MYVKLLSLMDALASTTSYNITDRNAESSMAGLVFDMPTDNGEVVLVDSFGAGMAAARSFQGTDDCYAAGDSKYCNMHAHR